MSRATPRWAIPALCVVLGGATLGGCAGASSRVALLTDEGVATAGAVAVLDPATGAERGSLTAANTQASLGSGPVRPRPLTGAFDDLLSAMPPPPQVFILYFVEGTTQLAPELASRLDELRRTITPASDVQITGYTDTTGDAASNDKLSLDRATQVREALVQQGLPVANARVTGRGERDLRVPTGDGVSEPANRRVEVIVR